MSNLPAFATTADLVARWRPLSEDETARALVLLDDASTMIRADRADVDDRIATGELPYDVPLMVACAMVKRAMVAAVEAVGVSAQQLTAGPFAQSLTFTNPTADLYLTRAEKRLISGRPRRQAFAIDMHGLTS